MFSFVLQEFVTIRGSSSLLTITQGESSWQELGPFQDLVVWFDVREVTLGGGSYVQFAPQTAPIKDEYLFVNMDASSSLVTLTTGQTSPKVNKYIMAQCANGTGGPYPLGRFLRWQIALVGGSPSGSWDATFRIVCTANAMGWRR